MRTKILTALLFMSLPGATQNTTAPSPMDPLSFGVVLDHPGMKSVLIKRDVAYLRDAKGNLHMDLYSPPGLEKKESRPAIIFLNAIGETPGARKVKSWGIYTTWPQLVAAHGYIGISMEADGSRIPQSIRGLFDFLGKNGASYNIDTSRLGVYAASANVGQSAEYLMKENAFHGIRAAVLYYGNVPDGPYRKDLPVLFVVAEGDVARNGYTSLWSQVLKNNAPWTIKMGSGMPHAFDAYTDNDEGRKIVRETISFWKDNLDPVPAPSRPYSKAREAIGLLQMNPPKAVSLLKSLSDEHPTDISTLSFYASALRDINRPGEAAEAYKKILTIDAKNIDALISLTAISYSQNKSDEASQYFSAAVNSGLMTATSYAQLGFTLLVANKNTEAAIYYEKAIALHPRNIDYYNLACAYAKADNKEKALTCLEKAYQLGYGSRQQFESDGDLDSLKSDDRFKDLLNKIK